MPLVIAEANSAPVTQPMQVTSKFGGLNILVMSLSTEVQRRSGLIYSAQI